MENTQQNFEKLKAKYWGQKVGATGFCKNLQVNKSNFLNIEWLELTPLSMISDEDAIEVAMMLVCWQSSMQKLSKIKIRGRQDGDHNWDELILEFSGSHKYTVRYRGGDWLGWIDSNGRCEWTLFNHLKVYDFLRSKGYALPFMGLSVEQQIEFGWVKLKTE